MNETATCPTCSQADQVQKVSTIYLVGIDRTHTESAESLRTRLGLGLSPAELQNLSRRLAPPSSGRTAPIRPIHPDLAVFAFTFIAPVFLSGIYQSQRVLFIPALLILGLAYGVYFWQRKKIVSRFEKKLSDQKSETERIKQGIAAWMKLYYCARDDGVFEAGKDHLIPVDQMMGFLLHNKS